MARNLFSAKVKLSGWYSTKRQRPMQTKQPKFKFYATLLDAFTSYLKSDAIWERYWGFSENPPHTPEEFRQQQFQSLIDTINRAAVRQ